MKKAEIIAPASTVYTVKIITNFGSVSTPYDTLEKAKTALAKELNELTQEDTTFYKYQITKRTWKPWYKGCPAPTPTEQIIS